MSCYIWIPRMRMVVHQKTHHPFVSLLLQSVRHNSHASFRITMFPAKPKRSRPPKLALQHTPKLRLCADSFQRNLDRSQKAQSKNKCHITSSFCEVTRKDVMTPQLPPSDEHNCHCVAFGD